ncbi:MAG: valine--tRNA ligase [Armatimonadaceae bacterium]
MELPTRYEPQSTEEEIYRRWMEAGCFRAIPDSREPYCITVPPPNVTGALHMGHALNHTIMDTLGRWKRMLGYNTLILPGTDHAGIATQSVVEREIAKENLTRHDLGREKFVERVWEWKAEYGGRIVNQLQRLGCGYDWDRLRFTMDESYVDAILTVFEKLYGDGLIYLGFRIVNWCPQHRTAISDIEVEHEEENSFLYHIRYDFADGSGSVTVATTRPETMLGDTAVAVNPQDPRYQGQIGKTLLLPLTEREIPLIGDDFAQMEFGTGAVKVTPAHDPNDYEAGQRNHLPYLIVIGPDGKMNENAGEYAGLDRFAARKRILEDLETSGHLVKTDPHTKSVGRCDRCGTVIEPLLSQQWFCKMSGTPMVEKAIRDADSGAVRFLPERYKEMFLRWMENIRDWPISRQLWWGHRLPLWRSTDADPENPESWVFARNHADAAANLGTDSVEQSTDVLDTWFSSALWPFATLGWPSNSPEAKRDVAYYYPTAALFTAQEILYLWVARMMMTGAEFIGEKPFSDVYVHATILDEHGRRMSKSKGNGVDPVDLIELYGADALRFALMNRAGMVQDIRIKPIKDGRQEQGEQARNFANKIWNASRFALMNLDDFEPRSAACPAATVLVDRWILSRLSETADTVNRAFESYNMDEAADALYHFFWDDFCDWYIEAAKPRFAGEGAEEAKAVLWFTLEQTLRLLHPIMPYLTEAIWQNLPGAQRTSGKDFLMFAAFPTATVAPRDPEAESEWAVVQEVTRAIRNLQAEHNLKKDGPAFFAPSSETAKRVAEANAPIIEFLTRFSPLTFGEGEGETLLSPTPYGDIRLPRPQASPEEVAAEIKRLQNELAKAEKDLSGLTARLSDPNFAERAPEAVVSKTRQQATELEERRAKLNERLAALGAQ